MSYRQTPSKFKNQILTAQKRDYFHSELDLTRDTIGNDSARTVQANHETIIFSCGNSGVGFVPLNRPGKFGFQHAKANCGRVSDLHISPFCSERMAAVTCTDQSVRVFNVPNVEAEDVEIGMAIHEFRASAGTANTPVLVSWNPQVSGVLAVASGSKVDIFSLVSAKVECTIDITSPAITFDWSHDGARILVISKDSILRVIDPRKSEVVSEIKFSGTKHVLRALPDDKFLVSSLSRMRERELNLYGSKELSKSINSWNFGTASTPLIPIIDTARKISYLLDKSGGVLRWIESFAPFNEGAAGTSVEQSSSGCLIHPFGLQLMEGEINRVIIADTKGNTVPVKITIGRKSYLEFHDDIYTPIEVESSIAADQWFAGENGMAKMAKVQPSLVSAALKGESLSKHAAIPSAKKTEPINATAKASEGQPSSPRKEVETRIADDLMAARSSTPQNTTRAVPNAASTLSAREQRKWDKEEAASKSASSREVAREDLTARRAEYGARSPAKEEPVDSSTPVQVSEQEKQPDQVDEETEEQPSYSKDEEEERGSIEPAIEEPGLAIGKGLPPALDDEDALEQIRARRVTPALEGTDKKTAIHTESPQPQREVYREDLNARRAEYGASPKPSKVREVYKEHLGDRRAEYGASAKSTQRSNMDSSVPQKSDEDASASLQNVESAQKVENSGREIYREDLSARRAEYGAPANQRSSGKVISARSPVEPVLSAREQRKWDKDSRQTNPAALSEVHKEDLNARRAEYGASNSPAIRPVSPPQSKPARTSTAEREIFKEDLTSRRAEYGATPTLDGPTQAYKDITKALGKPEPKTVMESAPELEAYKKGDELTQEASTGKEPSTKELEDAYVRPVREYDVGSQDADLIEEAPKARNNPETIEIESSATLPRAESPAPVHKAATAPMEKTAFSKSKDVEKKDYTRKYLQGKMQHPRNSYTSLVGLNVSLPNTARMIDATQSHIVIPLAGPGGRIGILPTEKPGRLPTIILGFMGGAQVVDFEMDRFVQGRVVSAHQDQAVRVWTIPNNLEDVETDIETPDRVLSGMDRIQAVSFHPLAKDLLMVTTSTKIHLFDVSSGEELKSYPLKGIANSAWSLDGNMIAFGKSDKSITVMDARTGNMINSFPSSHQSSRPFRLQFVGPDRLVTAGFNRASARQLALYDLSSGSSLYVHDMDISPSPFSLPYYDEMSSILYLIPRGSSAVLPFHIQAETVVPLATYAAVDPTMGTAFLSPQHLDTKEVEIARCMRLTTNEVSVVGFHIPRPAGDLFHDDIYPSHVRNAYSPSLSLKEWLAGSRPAGHEMVNLNPTGLRSAGAAGVGSAHKKIASGSTQKEAAVSDGKPAKKGSELDQMFQKAKAQDGDEPDYQNNAENTRWE